jgi:hypothetical protein
MHLGALRDRYLLRAEDRALNMLLREVEKEMPDLVLLTGDIFDSNLPSLSRVGKAAEFFRTLKDIGVPVYAIYGSHDFSPTKNTMVEVLSKAGLLNVVEYMVEGPKGLQLAGLHGRVGALERYEFPSFDVPKGPSVFAFHTAIAEAVLGKVTIKEEQMIPASTLPKGFTYYAGGHIHLRIEWEYEGRPLNYPGPLFLGYGLDDFEGYLKGEDRGFYKVELDGEARFEYVSIRPLTGIFREIDAEGLGPEEVMEEMKSCIKPLKKGEVALIKLTGTLKRGRRADVITKLERLKEELRRQEIYLYSNDRNLSDLYMKEVPKERVVEDYIKELASLYPRKVKPEFIKRLIDILGTEKIAGEKEEVYRNRILSEVKKLIGEK